MSAEKGGKKKAGLKDSDLWDEEDETNKYIDHIVSDLTVKQVQNRVNMLRDNIRIMNGDLRRLAMKQRRTAKMVELGEQKLEERKQLPYLVANVVEVLDMPDEEEQDGGAHNENTEEKKCVVIKTTTRQTVFLPVIGMVEAENVKPGELIGVQKDSYLVLDKLPPEYDSRVKAMEVDDNPTEDYSDIGGLDKQINELIEAIVRPMTHKDLFDKIGIKPPKGVLLYGVPGTGKTLLARACAAKTKACFFRISAPALVQMFIGDGAKMVRDAFALARERAPSIIFIDELDAIGTKRFDSDKSGDREVQRTMLELLNQLDGFSSDDQVKVIAATNRPDTLDPALLRSGRLDRKIEFPLPNEAGRKAILRIHANKMTGSKDNVNFDELARCTEDFNGAQLKAVCVEAGMLALRRGGTTLSHEDFMNGVAEVQAKKKVELRYYA